MPLPQPARRRAGRRHRSRSRRRPSASRTPTSPRREIILRRNDGFAQADAALRASCPRSPARSCTPATAPRCGGAIEAARANLIVPVLIGPEAKIRAVAQRRGHRPLAATRSSRSSTATPPPMKAVEMARAGHVEALMKGSLHTDELMAAVVPSATGLRTARRISHVFVLDVPTYPRLLMVTDAAINIYPDLEAKVGHLPERDRARARARHRQAEGRGPLRGRDRSIPRSRARSTPPRCARWPTAGRSSAASSTGRSPSTTRSRSRRRAPRTSCRRWPGRPTSCWSRTSRRATWWRSSCSTSPAPTRRASCWARACRSC